MGRASAACAVLATALAVAVTVCVWLPSWGFEWFYGATVNSFLHVQDTDQYARVADALLHGRVSLDLPVDEGLAALDNPYDFEARYRLCSEGAVIYWDYAFYEGSYYSYFGVVPAVLLYMPYQVLTGSWLPTPEAVLVLGLLAVVSLALLTVRVARRCLGETATPASLALAVVLVFGGSNVVYLVFVARTYSVPILASLALTALGLWLWMGARRTSSDGSGTRLSCWRLAAGSACMALNLRCRPQFVLACALAIPLFWDEIARKRTLLSGSSVRQTCAALVPFAVAWAPLLAYNFARFGSVFDFGSSYNLTGFDMTAYEQPLGTLAYLLYGYLAQPPSFTGAFPYVSAAGGLGVGDLLAGGVAVAVLVGVVAVRLVACAKAGRVPVCLIAVGACVVVVLAAGAVFVLCRFDDVRGAAAVLFDGLFGFAPREPMFGGYFWLVPAALLVFAVPAVRPELSQRGLFGFAVMLPAIGAAALVVDAHVAGITQRYFSDFGWCLMLASVLVLLALQARWGGEGVRGAAKVRAGAVAVALCLVFSAVVGGLTLLSPERYDSLAEKSPELYAAVEDMLT